MTNPLDHLVWGCPDLDAGMDHFEALTGVRPALGGSHKGAGTRNALISLGPGVYLEVMAPDLAQPLQGGGLGARLRALGQPGLIAWAARCENLETLAAAPHRLSPIGPLAMSRVRPDGRVLSWRLLFLGATTLGFPFFIDWLESSHPSAEAPSGVVLGAFEVHTPDVDGMSATFAALGLDAPLRAAAEVSLQAVLETSGRQVRLTSVPAPGIAFP